MQIQNGNVNALDVEILFIRNIIQCDKGAVLVLLVAQSVGELKDEPLKIKR
jgi:hypothetical protein